MALSLENSNLVWQKVKIALQSLGAKPVNVEALKALKEYLATVKSNPTLQFGAISDLTDAAVVADAACQIYAIYLKKQATATDAYAKFVNHASAGDGSTHALSIALFESGDEVLLVFPTGMPMSAGIVATSTTTGAAGTTDTTTGDGPNGFVVFGA
jgi:poly-gamma-glutamate capsule biosynthesis protein CapA/YwtB (metallophosphatase superfamily)